MADLATAYVQIIPSARGMESNLTGLLNGKMPAAGKSAGSVLGSSIVGAVKKVILSAGVAKFFKESLLAGGELEQLKGGVEKIFGDMDYSQIYADAANAYKDLNMSANEYLATINDVGASFSATMGDEKGYAVAKTGLQAISDYASGTGKSVDTLSEKFAMITRSTSSYQSIADQFSGILPATSKDFLKQAQAAGILAKKYWRLTDVPVAEYQEAVSKMLERGVEQLGLTGNTADEAARTLTGSLAAMKSALSNVLGNLALGEDMRPSLEVLATTTKDFLIGNLVPAVSRILTALPSSITTLLQELIPSNVWDLVNSMITNFATAVAENLPSVLDSGVQTLTTFIQGITTVIPTLSDAAIQMLDALKGYLVDPENLKGLLAAGGELLVTVTVGIIEVLGKLATTAIEVLGALGDYLTDAENLTELLAAAADVGSQIANAIWNSLKSVFSSLVANFPSLLEGISIGMGFSATGSLPGFATGLDYVPYDNFVARLHEGEMVLTKAQANALRGGSMAGGVVINQYIYSQEQTAADLMREARYEAERAVLLDV